MKKMIAVAVSCIMAAGLLFTGCGAGPSGSTKGLKQLSVQIGPNPETIDPALNSTVDGGTMILHAFEPLLVIDKNNNVVSGQAESWDVSEDGLTWTFHLRRGLKWSDGNNLTAEDFVFSWKRVADPATAAPYADTVLSMVKGFQEALAGNVDALGVSAPDASTFVVELAEPCTYFDKLAAFVTLCPVNRPTVEANSDAWAVNPESYISNGPFRMKEWVSGSHITFEKNPYYWNSAAVKLDEIRFALMEDSTAAYNAYQTGEILFAKDVPTEEIPNLTLAKNGGEFYIDKLLGTYYLSINMNNLAFKDVRVREALSISLDRNYLAQTLMQNTYSAATGFVCPGITDADGTHSFMSLANNGQPYIDNSDHKASLEKAKQLLAEAGYSSEYPFPNITYLVNDSGYNKAIAEYVQQVWGQLGINVTVDVMEWSSFTSQRRAGDFDIARNGWICDYNDPSNLLELFTTDNGNNDGSYSNPEFDAAMKLADSTADIEDRFSALHQAEDILMADVGMIPLAYYNDYWLQSSRIVNSWHSPYGYFMFMYADITP